ncbi:MAG TPA: FliM/FliN family flagellar motor switch protein [Candidatus Eremiobacteraceae bacterium]|nr:FliM/FliN family flagellar motor switch protein [Candidatus Eremiobacteraceae bacterium]
MDDSNDARAESPYAALGEIEVTVAARLGGVRMPLSAAAALCDGSLVTLDCAPDSPVTLLVNGVAIATGELVVTDDGELAVEISDVRP